jgi:XTP/dITP diphosphohydrolase
MKTLLIATRNAHKVSEIRGILGGGFECLRLESFPGAPNVVEDATTFAGNAAKKAVSLAQWLTSAPSLQLPTTGSPLLVMADDSGLEVDALGGAPGVHSARFAALDQAGEGHTNSDDVENNAKLLRLLKDVPEGMRTARFRCVIALAETTPHSAVRTPHLFEGACEGRLGFAARGSNGFGYDPLFLPEGYEQTFAELGNEVKNRLSHRAKALEKLRAWLAANEDQ